LGSNHCYSIYELELPSQLQQRERTCNVPIHQQQRQGRSISQVHDSISQFDESDEVFDCEFGSSPKTSFASLHLGLALMLTKTLLFDGISEKLPCLLSCVVQETVLLQLVASGHGLLPVARVRGVAQGRARRVIREVFTVSNHVSAGFDHGGVGWLNWLPTWLRLPILHIQSPERLIQALWSSWLAQNCG